MVGHAFYPATMRKSENLTVFVTTGRMNRTLGWSMMLTGMALAAAMDPWLFNPQSSVEYASSLRPAVRHVQGVLLGMSLLQLAIAHLLSTAAYDRRLHQRVAVLTASGATIYSAGYALGLAWPWWHGLVLVGSLLNFVGFASLLRTQPVGDHAVWISRIVPIVCFGILLDFTAGLFKVLPEHFVLEYFGAADGVRLRMMRLARVAAIALSVLTLLYFSSPRRSTATRNADGWGGFVITCGAIGMPVILATACFTSLHWKYFLVFPAIAVVVGVILAFLSSRRHAEPLETWGWAMIATSTSAGMLMGLYAFDGPFETPAILGQYNETPRRLSWLAHSYCIVLGIMAVFLARESNGKRDSRGLAKVGTLLFAAGSAVTVGALVKQIFAPSSTYILAVGPAMVVMGATIRLALSVFTSIANVRDMAGRSPIQEKGLTMKFSFFRRLLKPALAIAVLLGLGYLGYQGYRLWQFKTLFAADKIDVNFRETDRLFDTNRIRKGDSVFKLQEAPQALPRDFSFKGETISIRDWIGRSRTTGLVVMADNKLVFEQYYQGNTAQSRPISWSVGKSFVSSLIGFALADGSIKSLQDPVDLYVPLLKDSGYSGVSIQDVLEMSSGIDFSENYADAEAGINAMGMQIFLGRSTNAWIARLQKACPPGKEFHYISVNTQVLGMVLEAATKQKLASYMEKKLWSRLGTEADALWLTDAHGTELGFCGLNVRTRDNARFGLLYLNQGRNLKGEQVLPPQWIQESVTPRTPYLQPGRKLSQGMPALGYAYQFWIPQGDEGEFMAIGVYGQFIYVNPMRRVVIAKNSAYVNYNVDGELMEFEAIEAFRAIARQVGKAPSL